jgi:hypothetical protein
MRSIIKKWKAGVIALSTGALVVSCNSDFLDRPTLGTMDETTFLKIVNKLLPAHARYMGIRANVVRFGRPNHR